MFQIVNVIVISWFLPMIVFAIIPLATLVCWLIYRFLIKKLLKTARYRSTQVSLETVN